MITEKKFTEVYNKAATLSEIASFFKVSIGTIKNYAKKLGLEKGKGNRVNHKKKFTF